MTQFQAARPGHVEPWRPGALRRAAMALACVLLAATLAVRLKRGRPPYLERPLTIVDHVGPRDHEIRPALALLPTLSTTLPENATVACFRPVDGRPPGADLANTLTAVSLLPRLRVVPPAALIEGALPDYLVVVGPPDAPFQHPAYTLQQTEANGRLYRRRG